ncbi:hypothetical protein F5H01DRAFT_377281 [Linnemannia elongata]|nr:hypothetical protein F5H01DRAFT_377281 [Linnemannia elongata]
MSISWNPVTRTEFITASTDGSVRVWRVSSDDGTVAVRMLRGSNLRNLCTAEEHWSTVEGYLLSRAIPQTTKDLVLLSRIARRQKAAFLS